MSLGSRVLAVAASAVLIASLTPAVAMAASPEHRAATLASGLSTLDAQAAKKTVYVITQCTVKSSFADTHKRTFSYNGKGLLKKATLKYGSDTRAALYAYDKNNNLKRIRTTFKGAGGSDASVNSFAVSKAGVLKKEIRSFGNGAARYVFTYKASKGHVASYTSRYQRKENGSWKTETGESAMVKGAFTCKNGHVVKHVYKDGYGSFTQKYGYDSKGNVSKFSIAANASAYRNATVKNTYTRGQVTKRVLTDAEDPSYQVTITYKYKRVKLPAALAAKAEAQKQGILGNNMNLSVFSDTFGYGFNTFAGSVSYIPWG